MRLVSPAEIRGALTWERAADAIAAGHRGARPEVQDILLGDPDAITLYKNAGGAHFDLLVAGEVLKRLQ